MISIIIPVYNTAKYLDQCIQSVVEQSYTNWECILVNDGSSDNSGQLCDKWARRDSRIKVIHQANQGVSVARNMGITASSGEYIVFIDSDDWVESYYLQDLFNNRDGCELVVSGIVGERENGNNVICIPLESKCFALSYKNIEDFVHLNKNALLYGPVNKLFLAGIIKEYQIQFSAKITYGEDLLFSFNYLKYVKRIATVKNLSYHYNMRNNTLSSRVRDNQFDNDYQLWTIRRDFMVERCLWTVEMQSVMYTYLWGNLYNGIFLFPTLKEGHFSYLRRILSIPEIDELFHYKELISCSPWIKYSILHRWAWVFYLHFKLRNTHGL